MDSKANFIVLLVEDNPPDAQLVKFLFSKCPTQVDLHFAVDGAEAGDFFFKRDKFKDAPTPDLILMDPNLPKKNGAELLKEFKKHPLRSQIPIIMLTTSSSDIAAMG